MKTAKRLDIQDRYIKGLLEKDRSVIEEIKEKYFPDIKSFILSNKGNKSDAEDIFSEAILIIYQNILNGLKLKKTFSDYLFGICRNLWLKQLRKVKRSKTNQTDSLLYENLPDDTDIEQSIILRERYKLFTEKLDLLSTKCREILQFIADGLSLKEAGQKMDLTPDYAKLKVFRCRKKLAELIKKDSRYNELKI